MMSNFGDYSLYRKQERFASEVDDVEMRAVELGEASFESAHLDEIATGQFVEDQSASESQAHLPVPAIESTEDSIRRKLRDKMTDIGRGDLRRDESISGISAEIERRIAIMKDAYPFSRGRGSLRIKDNANISESVYISLLRFSAGETTPNRDSFENVVADALKAYLGKDRSEVMCFGWRAEAEEDRPRRIKGMMDALYEKSGEWSWSPGIGFPDDPPPQMVKDLGIDVIAWIPMPDGRIGQVFLIAQCATGATNWESKGDDVNWGKFGCWIRPLPQEWGTRCFAVPFHVPNARHWELASNRSGLFLDRARITLLLQE